MIDFVNGGSYCINLFSLSMKVLMIKINSWEDNHFYRNPQNAILHYSVGCVFFEFVYIGFVLHSEISL